MAEPSVTLPTTETATKKALADRLTLFLEHHNSGKAELEQMLAMCPHGSVVYHDLNERVREFVAVGNNIARVLKTE